jgi:hypothetical protein
MIVLAIVNMLLLLIGFLPVLGKRIRIAKSKLWQNQVCKATHRNHTERLGYVVD